MAGKMINTPGAGFIKFLGTSGARFVMIRQLRRSGGLWINCRGANILVDPGPGCLVHCAKSRPKLDPAALDAIILTHRHLDHCNDVNVMIEAMTEGGFKKRGVVFCPEDALTGDPVVLKYIRNFPERIEVLHAGRRYQAGNFLFETSCRHIHPVETYGLKFDINGKTVGLLSDTGYFPGLSDFYRVDVLIAAVVFPQPRPGIAHLSVEDLKLLLPVLKPGKTILTHFGMGMLKAKPQLVARELSRSFNLEVIPATDGLVVRL